MSTYNEAERVYRDPIRYESNFVFNFNDSKNVVYEDSTGHHVFRWTRSYWETPEGAEQYYVIESRDLKGNATAFSIYEHYIVVRYFSPFGMLKVRILTPIAIQFVRT